MACSSETSVQSALVNFLKQHTFEHHVSDVDEIVLSYVLSILEDLGDGASPEEDIDVDQFIEVMDAYIPGFGEIDSVKVCEWMFELASALKKGISGSSEEPTSPTLNSDLIFGACKVEPDTRAQARVRNQNSTGDSERSCSESSQEEVDSVLDTLVEMFPGTLRLELDHCLQGAQGDVEAAVQLVLNRQEAGLAITQDKQAKAKKSRAITPLDDKKAKEKLMERYGFIDVDEDKRQHKPSAPKTESKKLVRYLDSQVVNTKGQKFTEIKKDDSEEMKKTYINLKPAKKYRFH
ncbi:CUE domain-containing protein 2-like [Mya arenaria]|uniref:CUE domain-containing protein 2-like n=1 Tax=Mya arenaria TaxID=6604 RepID=UPI0022DF1C26|nr:CUE domain-containing protein 2-like [Mya arenaria]